jgi:hypothetical protein
VCTVKSDEVDSGTATDDEHNGPSVDGASFAQDTEIDEKLELKRTYLSYRCKNDLLTYEYRILSISVYLK